MSKKTRSSKKSSRSLAASLAAIKKSKPAAAEKTFSAFQFPRTRAFFSQRKNILLTLAVLIVFGLLYLFKDVFIVAVVNGQPIYRWTVVAELEKQGGQQVLDSLVVETLVRQAIKNSDVAVSQAEIDANFAEIEASLAQNGMTLETALAQEGLTREEVAENFVLQKSAEKLVASTVTVSEDEITAYLESNGEFMPATATEQELRNMAREQIYSTKAGEAIQQWVQELQTSAKIIRLKEYKAVAPF